MTVRYSDRDLQKLMKGLLRKPSRRRRFTTGVWVWWLVMLLCIVGAGWQVGQALWVSDGALALAYLVLFLVVASGMRALHPKEE